MTRHPLPTAHCTLPTIHYPLLLALLVCSGCGTREYERRLESSASKLRTQAKFNELYGEQVLPGTPVAVRVPKIFTESPLVEGVPVGGKPVDPIRVKPTQVTLPGLKLTYETFIDDPEGRKMPFYCYVGTVDLADGKIKDPAGAMRKQLEESNPKPESLTNWTDVQAHTPDGRSIPWKQLRCIGKQDFFCKNKAGQEQTVNESGVLEINLCEEGNYLIVIAWRAPASIEQKADLAKWAPLVDGCVTVKK